MTPKLLKGAQSEKKKIDVSKESIKVAKEGMRMAVTSKVGTLRILKSNTLNIAGKTGTAQTGKGNKFKNSWVIAFWPYESPKYAIVILMEKAPVSARHGAIVVAREFFSWLENAKIDLLPNNTK